MNEEPLPEDISQHYFEILTDIDISLGRTRQRTLIWKNRYPNDFPIKDQEKESDV